MKTVKAKGDVICSNTAVTGDLASLCSLNIVS